MTLKSEGATTLDVSYDSQLMQDYLQSAGILVNQNPTSISAFQNSEGQTEAVVIGDDGQLYHAYRDFQALPEIGATVTRKYLPSQTTPAEMPLFITRGKMRIKARDGADGLHSARPMEPR